MVTAEQELFVVNAAHFSWSREKQWDSSNDTLFELFDVIPKCSILKTV